MDEHEILAAPESEEDFVEWLGAALSDTVEALELDMDIDTYDDGLIVTLGNGQKLSVTVREA